MDILPPTEFPGIALVTGAGGGIGSAVAHAFLRAGCTKMILTDLSPTSLQTTLDSLQALASTSSAYITIFPVPGDISSPDFISALFSLIRERFGRLDYAVNCAGIRGTQGSSTELRLEDYESVMNINYKSVWMCAKAEVEIMRKQQIREREGYGGVRRQRGAIVNIASQLGIVGRPDSPLYCASKSAVLGLTRCDAIDNSRHLIRINAVCPGVIDTPMTNASKRDPSHPQFNDPDSATPGMTEAMQRSVNIAPMQRMGQPEEIADVALFLCSEKASFVQGAAFVADGGYTIV